MPHRTYTQPMPAFPDFAGADDILSELFGRSGREGFRGRGADVRYRLAIDFLDAVNGATKRLTLPDGAVLDVVIPPGTRGGQVLRLRGKGLPATAAGRPATRWSRSGLAPPLF